MRILQILEATLGGTRRYLENVFESLELSHGAHEHALAYSLERADGAFYQLLERMRACGWQLFEIPMRRRTDLLYDLRCAAQFRAIMRSFSPDIIHAHSSKGGAIARLASVGFERRAAIVYAPNSIAVNVNKAYGLAERLLGTQTQVLAAVTESERAELRAMRIVPWDRVMVIKSVIDGAYFLPRSRDEARASLGLNSDPIIVGIGRLCSQKDPVGFVRILEALRTRVPGVRAIWVGDGELRDAVLAESNRLGVSESLTITGWVSDVRPFLAACNLFVSTSAYESFGYVTAEALAMERPVVASAITGTIDIVVTDVPLALYPPGGFDVAADRAATLLRDPNLASDVAARARLQVLNTFSRDAMCLALDSVYAVALSYVKSRRHRETRTPGPRVGLSGG